MKTWPRLGAVVAAASLLVTGCGGSDEGAQTGAGGLPTLRVADTAGIPLAFLTYGSEQGFFEDAGLNLEITSSVAGPTVIPQLISGDLDVADSNVVSALVAASQGLPIQLIAAGTSTSEDPEQDFSALVVAADSPITDISQLEGQRVAVNSLRTIADVVFGRQLEEAGLPYDSLDFVEYPFPDTAAAVQQGDVAAGFLIEPFITVAEEQGLRVLTRPYSDLKPGLQVGGYLMTEEMVQERPELAEAFLQGVQATGDAIAADPDAFRAALPELSDIAPELAETVRLPLWGGETDRESLELIQGGMVDYGLIDSEVDLDSLIVS